MFRDAGKSTFPKCWKFLATLARPWPPQGLTGSSMRSISAHLYRIESRTCWSWGPSKVVRTFRLIGFLGAARGRFKLCTQHILRGLRCSDILCALMRHSWEIYQQPNNRILLLPFMNGSQAQKVRLIDFWLAKDAIYIPERNLGKTYNEKIRFIFRSKEFLNDVSNDIIYIIWYII